MGGHGGLRGEHGGGGKWVGIGSIWEAELMGRSK